MKNREEKNTACENDAEVEEPEAEDILEEIEIEDLAVDGICGVY